MSLSKLADHEAITLMLESNMHVKHLGQRSQSQQEYHIEVVLLI